MYTILRIYSDFVSATEKTDAIINAFSACAIYLEDPDCIGVKVWNTNSGEIIVDYWKE